MRLKDKSKFLLRDDPNYPLNMIDRDPMATGWMAETMSEGKGFAYYKPPFASVPVLCNIPANTENIGLQYCLYFQHNPLIIPVCQRQSLRVCILTVSRAL
jgi:hypothetical protein